VSRTTGLFLFRQRTRRGMDDEKIIGETPTEEGHLRRAIQTPNGQAEHRYLDPAGRLRVVGKDAGGGAVVYTCLQDDATLTVTPISDAAEARAWLAQHLSEEPK